MLKTLHEGSNQGTYMNGVAQNTIMMCELNKGI